MGGRTTQVNACRKYFYLDTSFDLPWYITAADGAEGYTRFREHYLNKGSRGTRPGPVRRHTT